MDRTIQRIFAVTLLACWVVFGVAFARGDWSLTNWLMLALAHLTSAVVFRNFAWLFTYGYAFSMVAVNGVVLALLPGTAALLVAGLGVAYGLRLWVFLHRRYASPAYAPIRARGDQAGANVPTPARVFLWIAVSWLMTFLGMAGYRVAADGRLTVWVLAGAALMLLGLILESLADAQKQAAKARDPAAFVNTGLYRRIRHPNYLGEILFQLGLITACAGSLAGPWQALGAWLAPAYIVALMISEARKADRQQAVRHGDDPAWRDYRERSGSLLPR